jgi:hypothetical protein
MKKILIITLILASGYNVFSAKSKVFSSRIVIIDTLPTDQLIPFLEQINVNGYYGMPIDSFLTAIPANIYNEKVYGSANTKPPTVLASHLRLDFTANQNVPGVRIFVREFNHVNKYSSNGLWDITLFRKEKIYRIEIWRDQNTCINGYCLE